MIRKLGFGLLLLLLFAVSVQARQVYINSAADLPHPAQSGDTIHLPGDTLRLSASSNAVSVLNSTYYYGITGGSGINDVQVNFHGTVVYIDINGGPSSVHQAGIILRGSLNSTDNNSVIGPGKIIREIGPGSEGGNENSCLIIAYDRNTLVRDMDFVIDGDNGTAVEGEVNGYNTRFINCSFTSNSNSFRDRQYFSSGGLKLSKPNQNYMAGPGQFQYIVDSCEVYNSPHFGIALYDSKAYLANCSLYVDAQNVRFDTLACFDGGNCGVGRSSANSYSVVCNFAKPGSEIAYNVITSGRDHGGARGIFIENSTTSAADPIRVHHNELYLNAGPDGENSVGWLRGIRLRTLDGGYHLDHVYIYDNYIEGIVDDDPSTTAIGQNAVLLQWGLGGPDAGYGHLRIERNTVLCRSLTGGTTGIAAGYCIFEGEGITTVNAIIQNNHYYSSDYVVWPVDLNNAGSAHDLLFNNDTLSFLPAGDSGVMNNPVTWRIGNYLQDSWDIRGRDCVYLDGASDTNIVFHNSSTHEIVLEKTIRVQAMGDNGLLIDGAQVTVSNGYGQNILFGTTSSGSLTGVVSYWYESNGAPDSTGFNPFQFSVSKDAVAVDSVTAVRWDRDKYIIRLNGLNGTIEPTIDPLSNLYNFSVDVLSLDFNGEADSIVVSYQTSSDGEPDSIIYCYSAGAFPDSSAANRVAVSYSTNALFTDNLTPSVNDPDSLFFSYWTKKNGSPEGWSGRGLTAVYVADLVAPAKIDSLYAEPGPASGSVDFIWEATGSDAIFGTAAYDSIKYFSSPITNGNWSSAWNFNNPSPPKPSGQFDTITISGLTPGKIYSLGIKAYDIEGNSSPLATTSGFARGILVPSTAIDSLELDPFAGSATVYALPVLSYHQLYYQFELDSDSSYPNPQVVDDNNPGTYTSATFTGLDSGVVYFWRCRAIATNESESSDWSPSRAFEPSTGAINMPPTAPSPFAPGPDGVVTSVTPTLLVNNSVDPDGDPLTYYFELYDDAQTELIAFADQVDEGTDVTPFVITDSLANNEVCFWRARSHDGQQYSPWMTMSSFTVISLSTGFGDQVATIAYPNPALLDGNRQVTFDLPDNETVDLLIQTVSGETVRLITGVTNSYVWDMSNESGHTVAVGIYLWYVTPGTSRGKIIVKP